MPVGASPVQLRLAKAEGRHTKNPVIHDGVFVESIVLDTIVGKLLFPILKLHIRHDAPKGDIAGPNPAKHDAHLHILLSNDSDKTPVLDFFHRNRAISGGRFPDWRKQFAILLNSSRLTNNIESEREQTKLEELRLFLALAPCGELKVMEAIGVEDYICLKVWVINLSFRIENCLCLIFPLLKVFVIYVHVFLIIQTLLNNSKLRRWSEEIVCADALYK